MGFTGIEGYLAFHCYWAIYNSVTNTVARKHVLCPTFTQLFIDLMKKGGGFYAQWINSRFPFHSASSELFTVIKWHRAYDVFIPENSSASFVRSLQPKKYCNRLFFKYYCISICLPKFHIFIHSLFILSEDTFVFFRTIYQIPFPVWIFYDFFKY